uniref:Uncharacterized protein n=1 Tax=Setaria viridis TaxID=4556 RepID=A0A4U6TB26_SETVI|nr:hypothetical protein SEVIR_9G282475v2 [Setaria viridis]
MKEHHGDFIFVLLLLFANLSGEAFMCSRLQSVPRIWSRKWHSC